MINTINPSTENFIQAYPLWTDSQIEQGLKLSQDCYQAWQTESIASRAKLILRIADKLLEKKDYYSNIITEEMGKPITQARAEIEKCAWVCQHYAAQTEDYLKPHIIQTELQKCEIHYRPLGTILAIMPWNFPFWQVFRLAIPTLMAGNVIVLKHAPNSTGAALAIAELFKQCGAPAGLFQSMILSVTQTEQLIEHPAIMGVSLTGSNRAGRRVAALAGAALKKVLLELGGNDPYLILEDADLEQAAQACVFSRLNNAGQVCIAAKRILVCQTIYDEFLALIKAKMQYYNIGDPKLPNTTLGPLARADIRDQVHQQVQQCVSEGAQLTLGGTLPNCPGFYYPATLLEQIGVASTAFKEEIFGPVLAVTCVKDALEAVELANQSTYGLTAAIFSRNQINAEKLAIEVLNVGVCAINTYAVSDPRLPFGGIKDSGFGRELGPDGVQAFTNIKTIMMK